MQNKLKDSNLVDLDSKCSEKSVSNACPHVIKKMSTSFSNQQIRGWYQEYLTNQRAGNSP